MAALLYKSFIKWGSPERRYAGSPKTAGADERNQSQEIRLEFVYAEMCFQHA